MTFSRLLKYLFDKFKEVTFALLIGFMVGSLYKVWPWKNEVGSAPLVIHSDGSEDWAMQNVLPAGYQGEDQLVMAVISALGGLLLIIILERFAPKDT